jgi:hypothetical protein
MTTTTQVSVPTYQKPTLRPDGLGPFDFGDPAEPVEAALVALLGPPAGEGDEFGSVVYWDGLLVEFGLAEYDKEATVDYFSGWLHSGPGRLNLTTADGIGPGSTISALKTAFGDHLDVPSEPHPSATSPQGQLAGTSADPATRQAEGFSFGGAGFESSFDEGLSWGVDTDLGDRDAM